MPERARPATLHDVANEAGVSLATASRSLNGSVRKVNESYRKRVLEAAAKLGYTPNLSAQAVARGTSATVALVVSDIADPYFSSIAAGVVKAANAEGLLVTMTVSDRDADVEIELVRMLRAQRPRIIVLAGSRFRNDARSDILVTELEAYRKAGGRVVLISQREMPFDTVMIDNAAGATSLARTLVDLGYRGFAVLAGPDNLVTATERLEAFATELKSLSVSLEPRHTIHGDFTRDGGYDAMNALVDAGLDGIDVVFAVNDVMAVGALAALRDRGIDVPGSVALAGFDDISTARDVFPALTTVQIPLEDAGIAAISLALGEEDTGESVTRIPVSVVLRASTPRR